MNALATALDPMHAVIGAEKVVIALARLADVVLADMPDPASAQMARREDSASGSVDWRDAGAGDHSAVRQSPDVGALVTAAP
jgi:hypothetical protein